MAINSQMNSDIGIHSGLRVPKSQLKRNESNNDEFSKIFQSKANEPKSRIVTSEVNEKKFEEVKPKDTEKFDSRLSRDKVTSPKEEISNEEEINLEEKEALSDKTTDVVLEDFLALLNQPLIQESQEEVLETAHGSQILVSEELTEAETVLLTDSNDEALKTEADNNSNFLMTENETASEPVVAEAMLSETNLKENIKKMLNVESSEISDTHLTKASETEGQDQSKFYPLPENPKVYGTNENQVNPKSDQETAKELAASKKIATEEPMIQIVQEPKGKEGAQTFKVIENEDASDKGSLVQVKDTTTSGLQQMMNRQPVGIFTTESSTLLPKTPIVNQVFEMIKGPIQLSEAGTMLKMKLQPEELGQVQLKLSLQKGLVLAEIKVENELVKAAMESNIEQLKQSLSNKGFQVSQVSVAVDLNNKEQAQSQFNQSNQGQNQRANKYFETQEEFNDESIFEALQLKDRGIGTSIDYSG